MMEPPPMAILAPLSTGNVSVAKVKTAPTSVAGTLETSTFPIDNTTMSEVIAVRPPR
jgi:hypothetical protein